MIIAKITKIEVLFQDLDASEENSSIFEALKMTDFSFKYFQGPVQTNPGVQRYAAVLAFQYLTLAGLYNPAPTMARLTIFYVLHFNQWYYKCTVHLHP